MTNWGPQRGVKKERGIPEILGKTEKKYGLASRF